MTKTIRKGNSVEDMPRVTEVVWRVGITSSEPFEIKIVKRNPKSIDILYIMRGLDGRVVTWEVWRQYPDEFGTVEVKSKREAWERIIRWKRADLTRAKVAAVDAAAAVHRAQEAMDNDKEVR